MSCSTPQKVIIPKGMVKPGETTIVEIPKELKWLPTVIAQRKETKEGMNAAPRLHSPVKVVNKKSFMKRTYPPAGGGSTIDMDDMNVSTLNMSEDPASFAGRPTDQCGPRVPILFDEPSDAAKHNVSYVDSLPSQYEHFDKSCHQQALHSSYKGIDDNSLPYYKFRPGRESSPVNRYRAPLNRTPPSFRNYQYQPPEQPESYTEVTTEETETYYDQSSSGPCQDSGGSSGAYQSGGSSGAYTSGGSSGAYKNFDSVGNSMFGSSGASGSPGVCPGASQTQQSSSLSPWNSRDRATMDSDMQRYMEGLSSSDGSPYGSPQQASGPLDDSCDPNCPSVSGGSRQMTQADMMDSLGSLEKSELERIMGDLSQYQSARRKLVFDASSLTSAADVSRQLLGRTI